MVLYIITYLIILTLLPKLSGKRARADSRLHKELSVLNVGANTGMLFI